MQHKFIKIAIESVEHSKKVQDALFKLGYKWYDGPYYKNLDQQYLYTTEFYTGPGKGIGWGYSKEYFEDSTNVEYELRGKTLVEKGSDYKEMKIAVRDNKHSEAIQEVLFAMGYAWIDNRTYPQYTDAFYLYTSTSGNLSYGDLSNTFEDSTKEEFVLEDGELIAKATADAKVAHEHVVKPPLGLRPRFIVAEARLKEILEAMHRYVEAGMAIPDEWDKEYYELRECLNAHYNK